LRLSFFNLLSDLLFHFSILGSLSERSGSQLMSHPLQQDPGIAEPTFDPAETAARALQSESDCRMVLANFRYLLRHFQEYSRLIELTGAHLFLLSGAKELRRIAETAEESPNDALGHAVCFRLLSGYWIADSVARSMNIER
jgi:hypothetical protein